MTAPDWETYRDIVGTVVRFGRALDENDWKAYRACLADSVTADYRDAGLPEVTVDADDWTDLVRAAVSPQITVHYFTNFEIDVDEELASCVFAHQSSHHVAGSSGDSVYVQRGRYFTTLSLDDRSWKLIRIAHRISFATGNPGLAGPPSAALLDARERLYS